MVTELLPGGEFPFEEFREDTLIWEQERGMVEANRALHQKYAPVLLSAIKQAGPFQHLKPTDERMSTGKKSTAVKVEFGLSSPFFGWSKLLARSDGSWPPGLVLLCGFPDGAAHQEPRGWVEP